MFTEALPPDLESRVTALQPFEVITCMRERTAFPRALLEKLPNLKLLVTTGMGNASFDMKAAKELGVTVCGARGAGSGTSELTWGLIIALARGIVKEDIATRAGHWETTVGIDLLGHTLGCMGLGNLGSRVAKVGLAFGMNVIAWSQNLTAERAAEVGAKLVSQGRADGAVRLPQRPPCTQRPHSRADQRAGPGEDEAGLVPDKHVARADRRP